jgi:hypothetical protein
MTDVEAKALALINEEAGYGYIHARDMADKSYEVKALCRAIEQHEAFKQEVSKAMTYIKALYPTLPTDYDRFIIPKPKPDELVEQVLKNMDVVMERLEAFRAALEVRGLEIREKGQ